MWVEDKRRGARALWATVCVVALAGCAGQSEQDGGSERSAVGKSEYPVDSDIARQTGDPYTDLDEDKGSLFDASTSFGLPGWLGGDDDEDEAEAAAVAPGSTGIQVNGHLWGAALDTVSFMPLETADPEGGIIKTEWYSEPDRPDERHRVHVFIISGQLRADGVRVSVFRQIRNEQGEWVTAEPPADTASALKDVIVRRARELGTASTG